MPWCILIVTFVSVCHWLCDGATVQDASVLDAAAGAGVKPTDQRQSGSVSSPQSSSVPAAHPLSVPMLQSQWPGVTDVQWTGSAVVVSAGQPAAGNAPLPAAPAVSLSPGSVLPINLLPAELSSLLGMSSSSAALSSASLPVSLLLPGGLLVSADSGNVHDPLASLSRLSTGIQNAIPAANINNNMVTAAAREIPENTNRPNVAGIKLESETVRSYGNDRLAGGAVQLGNRLAVAVSEPSRLPGGLGSAYAVAKSQHPQQPSTVGLQLPLVSESPQTVSSSSVHFPALHQLLQQGTTSRNAPPAPPAYTEVSETIQLATGHSSPATAESSVVPSSGRRRWTSADSAVLNRHSSHGYPEYTDNVAVNLFRQESSGFDISRNSPAPADSNLADPSQSANADKDAVEFFAPSGQGLHHKFRRKNRPQPLIIPSPVGHFGFQSRLRSPRISSDQSGPGLQTETSSSAATAAASSLPVASVAGLTPYTPPPMLSPVRTGSGLFYSLVQPSPKSAPVGFRLGLLRCSKTFCTDFLLFCG